MRISCPNCGSLLTHRSRKKGVFEYVWSDLLRRYFFEKRVFRRHGFFWLTVRYGSRLNRSVLV